MSALAPLLGNERTSWIYEYIGAALLDPTDLLAQACVRSCLATPQEMVREVA